jgi:5-formyltetrahydrofolate cyclo-ligase
MTGKDSLRRTARRQRRRQPNKDALSEKIIERLMAMSPYDRAVHVMWYVDVRDEVRTRPSLNRILSSKKQIVVPYCRGDELRLFRLRRMDELSPGAFGILEPRDELRGQRDRDADPKEQQLVIVPGVAFDDQGGRLGHGQGFYDRLLAQVDRATVLVGLAYECQVFPSIPVNDHDIAMDWLVTEKRTIRCGGRLGLRAEGEGC